MKKLFLRYGTYFVAVVCFFFVVAAAAPSQVSAANPYTVHGVWEFNDTIDMCRYTHIYKNFRGYAFSAGDDPEDFYEFDYFAFVDGKMYISPTDPRFSGSGIIIYNNGNWLHEKSKRIDFGRDPVSVDETEYMWLMSNAKFVSVSPENGPLVDAVTIMGREGTFAGVFDQIVKVLPVICVAVFSLLGVRKGIAFVVDKVRSS